MLLPLLVLSLLHFGHASERLVVNFRLHSFKPLARATLPVQIVLAGNNRLTVVGHPAGNNTFKARLPIRLPSLRVLNETLRFTIMENTFLQRSVDMTFKLNDSTHVKLTTEDYKLHISTKIEDFSRVASSFVESPNGCGCITKNCACCETIDLPKLQFTHEICANISYNPETIGIDLAVGVDGHYYVHEISARNPPPVCFDVPYAKEIASLCLAFKKLDLTKKHLAGCAEVELELIHMRVAHVSLGCFDMPI